MSSFFFYSHTLRHLKGALVITFIAALLLTPSTGTSAAGTDALYDLRDRISTLEHDVRGLAQDMADELKEKYRIINRLQPKVDAGRASKDEQETLLNALKRATSIYGLITETVKNEELDQLLRDAFLLELANQGIVGDDGGFVDLSRNSSTTSNRTKSIFSDVSLSHRYHSAIEWAKQSGVWQGYPDGTFQPDRTVNRAEFLKIVLEAMNGNVNAASGNTGFTDVDEGAWYAPYVRFANERSIIQGYPDGTFKPAQEVNFAEALKMAYNALRVETVDTGTEWYERYLEHATLNNILYSNNARMAAGMSRKDVVWIVWKIMTHTESWKQAETQTTSARVHQESSQERNTSMDTGTENSEAVIKEHCREEWPNDFEMRVYCEKQQRDGVQTLDQGGPSDIQPSEFATIREHCTPEWPTNYEMRAYCEKQQYDGVRTLNRGRPSDIGESEFNLIRRKCTEDWPTNFEMRAYCEKQQYDAVGTLNQGKPSGVQQSDFETIRRLCSSEWPEDFEMKVYCENQKYNSLR